MDYISLLHSDDVMRQGGVLSCLNPVAWMSGRARWSGKETGIPNRRSGPTILVLALIVISISLPISRAGALTCRVPQDEGSVQEAIDNPICAVIGFGERNFVLVGEGIDETILSAGDGGRALDINGTTNQVVLRDLTIADGITTTGGSGIAAIAEELTLERVKVANNEVSDPTGPPALATGAGIYAAGKIRVIDSIVTGNEFQGTEIGYGGGIYIAGQSKLTAIDSVISTNVGATGGGIYSQSPVVIRNSTISQNAVDYDFGGGGGILIEDGKLAVFDSTIKRNTALASGAGGGGIQVIQDGRLSLVRSFVVGNKAPNGGGIYVGGSGEATIKDSSIRNNHATAGFGGGVINGGQTEIDDSAFSKNSADDGGGAIGNYNNGTSLILRNSTVSANSAANSGGGIDSLDGSSADLTNVTITENEANADGDVNGQGSGFNSDSSDLSIKNVISVDNAKVRGGGSDCYETVGSDVTSLGGNLLGDEEGCSGVLVEPGDAIGLDAGLKSLASNGGPTLTHALGANSAAIGRGRPGCPGSDQRGAPRDDCDSGAYERAKCEGALVAIIGTRGNDKLRGTNDTDGIFGLGGEDRLAGRGDTDGLCGGRGNDRLRGGVGNDALHGQGGNDTCIGGGGSDTAKGCETKRLI